MHDQEWPAERFEENGGRSYLRYTFFVLLFVATLVALASLGGVGVVGSPVLLVFHFIAARNTRSNAWRATWILLAGVTAAEGAWGLTYLVLGEREPWIWLFPVASAIAAAVLVLTYSTKLQRRA